MKSFNLVKYALSTTPILISPNYTHDFIIFSFSSEHTMAVVLMQKRDQLEKPIVFFSRTIRDATSRYNMIEKQALDLVKALKDFKVYILHSHTIAYVPNAAIKDVLIQTNLEGRRGKWITTMLEYDLEIKPTKLIKGQGLVRLMAESNLYDLDINLIVAMSKDEDGGSLIQVFEMFFQSPWCSDIVYVLQRLLPPLGMSRSKGRSLKLKAAKFCILNNALYWKDPGGVLLNCLVEDKTQQVMYDFHKGDCGGHLFQKTMENKVFRVGYYQLTLFFDVYKTAMSCHECQVFQGKRKFLPLPLKPVEVNAPFQQWGLDFIEEIHPTSSTQHKWILIETDYFTKWIEAIPTRQDTNTVIIQFLESNILSCFSCPNKIITNNAAAFKSKRMIEFCNKYNITLGHSTTYYPQGSGFVESSNKSLVNTIKKMLETNKKNWHKKLVNSLWADKVSHKKSIVVSPFELVYGIDTVFPTYLVVLVMRLLQEAGNEEDEFHRRINHMIHLQQTRDEVFQNTFRLQEIIKEIYDQKTKEDKFQLEDVVLQWDARNEEKGKLGKFKNLWKGMYKIAAYRGKNDFLLKEMDDQECPGGPVNGKILKHYYF